MLDAIGAQRIHSTMTHDGGDSDDEVSPYFSRLELKPKPVLSHDFGAGSPCLRCECPGLELHYWRKRCKVCTCRADEHDVELPDSHEYGGLVYKKNGFTPKRLQIDAARRRELDEAFRSRRDDPNRIPLSPNSSSTEASTSPPPLPPHSPPPDLEWAPEVEDIHLLKRYVEALPTEDRPIRGTKGVQKRRQRLQYQLPAYDCYPDKAVSVQTPEVREELERFVRKAQDNVAMGRVVWTDEPTKNEIKSPPESKLICRECRKNIDNDSVGVLPGKARPNKNDVWHPGCFKCEQCHDLLVDLLYFFKDGHYLCGRHFCEKTYERCAGCDELILDKQYTRAEQRSWHVQHFCCFGCDKHFMNEDYVAKQGQFYCLDCYLKKFAKTCLGCGQKIAAPEPYVTHNDLSWHKRPRCFRCRKCAKFLETKFLLKDQNTYCSDICKRSFEKIL